jgi:hypothetical protein
MNGQSQASSYDKPSQFRQRKLGQIETDPNHKFMQTIGEEMFHELERISKEKGIRVQTLLRAVIIPEWVQEQRNSQHEEQNSRQVQTELRERRLGLRTRDT